MNFSSFVIAFNILLKMWAPKYQCGLVKLVKLLAHMAPGFSKLFATQLGLLYCGLYRLDEMFSLLKWQISSGPSLMIEFIPYIHSGAMSLNMLKKLNTYIAIKKSNI